MHVSIYTDGGARGNPGPAATGVVIKNNDGKILEEYGEYLGKTTNNVAEYSALISALSTAKNIGATEVSCYLDSKLVVEQLNRNWKVKQPHIQSLFVKAWNILQNFSSYSLSYIPREKNKESDAWVNKILDERNKKTP